MLQRSAQNVTSFLLHYSDKHITFALEKGKIVKG